jgi:hypothetical protein
MSGERSSSCRPHAAETRTPVGNSIRKIAALEKRTGGKVLNAEPSRPCYEGDGFSEISGKVSRFRRLQSFKVFATLKPCHFATLQFPYLRMPSLPITVL